MTQGLTSVSGAASHPTIARLRTLSQKFPDNFYVLGQTPTFNFDTTSKTNNQIPKMAVLGKRKAPEPSISEEDAAAIFRRHFEAQFSPLPGAAAKSKTAQEDDAEVEDDGDSDNEEEDEDEEWGGLSDGNEEADESDESEGTKLLIHRNSVRQLTHL